MAFCFCICFQLRGLHIDIGICITLCPYYAFEVTSLKQQPIVLHHYIKLIFNPLPVRRLVQTVNKIWVSL